jgi:hypothetical protein
MYPFALLAYEHYVHSGHVSAPIVFWLKEMTEEYLLAVAYAVGMLVLLKDNNALSWVALCRIDRVTLLNAPSFVYE